MQNDQEYKKCWMKLYKAEAVCLAWHGDSLFVGLANGRVNMLKLSEQKKGYTESFEIEQHQACVSGMVFQGPKGQLHSVANDSRYRVLSIGTGEMQPERTELIFDSIPSGNPLTSIQINEERQSSYITDNDGAIFIYNISKEKPELTIRLQSNLRRIRGCCLDPGRGYLFVIGYESGQIGIFDIQKAGQEQHSKEIQRINSKIRVRGER